MTKLKLKNIALFKVPHGEGVLKVPVSGFSTKKISKNSASTFNMNESIDFRIGEIMHR